jgi:hypothetical protein
VLIAVNASLQKMTTNLKMPKQEKMEALRKKHLHTHEFS